DQGLGGLCPDLEEVSHWLRLASRRRFTSGCASKRRAPLAVRRRDSLTASRRPPSPWSDVAACWLSPRLTSLIRTQPVSCSRPCPRHWRRDRRRMTLPRKSFSLQRPEDPELRLRAPRVHSKTPQVRKARA